jgi:membrane protease YdiL (CAAX protease family)
MSSEILTRRSTTQLVFAAGIGLVGGEVLAAVVISYVAGTLHIRGGEQYLSALAAPPWWYTVTTLCCLWIGLSSAVIWASRRGNLPWRANAWQWQGPRDLGYLVVGVATQYLVDAAYAPLHLKNIDAPVHHLFGAYSGLPFLVIAVMTVVGAPIVEECFFRATLFRAFDESWTARWGRVGSIAAIAASATLFGLAHGELLQLPGLVFVGVVLAIVYRRSGRLLPSVLVHVGFNAPTVLALISTHQGRL